MEKKKLIKVRRILKSIDVEEAVETYFDYHSHGWETAIGTWDRPEGYYKLDKDSQKEFNNKALDIFLKYWKEYVIKDIEYFLNDLTDKEIVETINDYELEVEDLEGVNLEFILDIFKEDIETFVDRNYIWEVLEWNNDKFRMVKNEIEGLLNEYQKEQ